MPVVSDDFGGTQLPAHWKAYDGPYASGVHNCAAPSHVTVQDGFLHLLMGYQGTGRCGASWYTGGVELVGSSAIDQRVTVRFRVVPNGVTSHRIIPMRWPEDDSSWPAAGEEDYCETEALTGCSTYLHYSADNLQVRGSYPIDLSAWHTLQTTRIDHTVTVAVDGAVAFSYAGDATTLPDTVKQVVLQQECPTSGCPPGTTGSEDIQVDWITVENPATTIPSTPIDHVFVVVEENHSFDQIIGSGEAPYLNFLANTGVLATDHHAITYPSLPNYLALIGGDTFGITTDCIPTDAGCAFSAPNLADRLEAHGRTWRGYFDGMPSPCRTTSSGTYRVHHDPFVYFTDISSDATRCANGIRPIADLNADLAAEASTPSFALIVPDNCHDMHDCPISAGDDWLRSTLPAIFDSPAWTAGNSLLVLTFDEDDGLSQNHVATIVLGPSIVPHGRLGERSDHYRLLRTIEDIWALPPLAGNDAAAAPMPLFRGEPSPDVFSPTVPQGLTGIGVSPTRIDLTWSASVDGVGVESYEVFRDGAWLASTQATAFTDTSVIAGVTYTYRVRARDYAGNVSAYSTPVSITAPLPPQTGSGVTRGNTSTTVNATATGAISIAVPQGVASGDLLVACIATNGGGVSGSGIPPGWSTIAAVTGLANPKLFGYYHVATASEPAAYAWTLSGAVINAGGIVQYAGVDPGVPLDTPASTITTPLTTSVVLPGVTTLTPNAMLVGCVAANSSSTSLTITSPSGMSEAWDIAGKRHELADGTVPQAGATGSRTWTLSSARDAAGWLVALRAR